MENCYVTQHLTDVLRKVAQLRDERREASVLVFFMTISTLFVNFACFFSSFSTKSFKTLVGTTILENRDESGTFSRLFSRV